jgi:small subunit ribosomal protein S8
MSFDPIGDMFSALWNANHKYLERVDLPCSKVKKEIARVLKDEGYIVDFKILADRRQKVLRVFLKYMPDKTRVVSGVKRVSRPGLRVYRGSDKLPKVNGGLGISIVSTPKGIMTDKQSRVQKMGGEILAYVW